MSENSTTITQQFDQSPEEVFDAIRDVRGWWSKNIDGGTADAGDEFVYEVPGVHRCRIRLVDVVPARLVVWRVLENTFSFVTDQEEWTDTEVHFEITALPDGKTELQFTHVGLLPEFECFEVCDRSWAFYVGHSLRKLITQGAGQPNEISDSVEVVGARIDAALA